MESNSSAICRQPVQAAPTTAACRGQPTGNSVSNEQLDVVVAAITPRAQGVSTWELRRTDGADLPAFTAGSHVDLHLTNGMVRSYSLCNDPSERHRYVIGVARDPASRGGSTFIHEHLRVGDALRITAPRNNFKLDENAGRSVFIAGGIGITPLWCMVQRLEALGRPWELHYSTRLRALCAFHDDLASLEAAQPGRVHFNFDQEPGGRMTDLRALVSGLAADAHLYCCGPVPMLKAFEAAAKEAGRPASHVHVEYFSAAEQPAMQGGFTVVLERSGLTLQVAPGKSILQTLMDHGIDAPYSCMEGACGRCETNVLEGEPDHRDSVLSEEERASGQTMMICCSGSKGPRLVLDR
jgi:ferredoxin-NADP reductase